ncbi:response regulator [Pseudozobellia thermophila]|uniref:Response regulator receiver domain-containing protein n=1 Tax=Pseudozobellia thermophila TaxID=192903 RepID=A0A1M6M8W5_9FLAO|nr:response regulator [Pseudozobellia thermophila]SHJ79842.1 Response regulator receiver domain-containing protein [Pseudozobellia thermophila]
MSTKPMKVVLVDDDEDDRMFFSDALQEIELDTDLQEFNNGQELLNFLNRPEAELPQLIFLDLNMPVMDGFECLKNIRSNPELENLVVAIYSTSSSERDIEETFVNGANIYINKPNKFEELKKTIAQVVKRNWQYEENEMDKANFLFRI